MALAVLSLMSLSGAMAAVLELPVRFQNGYVRTPSQANAPESCEHDELTSISQSTVEVQVGTPPVSHALLFDTGSATTWMTTAECNASGACANNSGYNRTGYDAAASSTHESIDTSASISYISGGQVGGEGVRDVFSVPSQPGTSWLQSFLAADESSWFNIPADGFLGLAFDTISDANTTTLVETLMRDGLLDEPRFALYYGTETRNTNGTAGDGALTLGGSHEDVYVDGEVQWAPLDTPGAGAQVWRVNMQYSVGTPPSVVVDGNRTVGGGKGQVSLGGQLGVFDTGADRISVPEAFIEDIYASFGMNWTAIINKDVIPLCEDFTDEWQIEFTFGYYLAPVTLLLTGDMLKTPGFATGEDKYCWPPIDSSGSDGLFMFGADLLQKFYTVWDFGSFESASYNASIGFGKLKEDYKPLS